MRLLIAMMKHETNTFSPIPTPWQRFVEWGAHLGPDVVAAYRGTAMPIGAYIDLAERAGAELVTPIAAEAMPSGTVSAEAYRRLTDPILAAVAKGGIDAALLDRPGNVDIQLDLFLDYANNVKLYPAFHEYFRKWQPPLLAIWGKNDPYFVPAGAEAFRRDLPAARVQFLDTGHFALETHLDEIAEAMRTFLASL